MVREAERKRLRRGDPSSPSPPLSLSLDGLQNLQEQERVGEKEKRKPAGAPLVPIAKGKQSKVLYLVRGTTEKGFFTFKKKS